MNSTCIFIQCISYKICVFKVKISFFKEAEEVAYVVFNAAGESYNQTDRSSHENGTDVTSWFDCSRIVSSSWKDLMDVSPDICSIRRYKMIFP